MFMEPRCWACTAQPQEGFPCSPPHFIFIVLPELPWFSKPLSKLPKNTYNTAKEQKVPSQNLRSLGYPRMPPKCIQYSIFPLMMTDPKPSTLPLSCKGWKSRVWQCLQQEPSTLWHARLLPPAHPAPSSWNQGKSCSRIIPYWVALNLLYHSEKLGKSLLKAL